MMTRKQKRAAMILSGLAILGVALGLVLYALSGTIMFFYTPSEIEAATTRGELRPGQRIRLGGLVEKNSIVKGTGTDVSFIVTDMIRTMPVHYAGQLPDLFREQQGVVAEGIIGPNGVFTADNVLAKHDENYMPKEVADRLKEKGVWKEGMGEGS
jgi:cytochrome c-type biogenesis protein CcmE